MAKPVILCVDDEKSILDSLDEQLHAEFGSELIIEHAESGEEGLSILEEYLAKQIEIPVIIADYLMPGMRGEHFLIEAYNRTPQTCNILLTGQAGLDAVATAINQANLYRYITKPWDRTDLLFTVKEAITSFRQRKLIQSQNTDLQLLNSRLQLMNKELEAEVTKRIQDLQRQKVLFKQIFDNSPDGMAIFDAEAKFITINKAFESMFQYQASEITGLEVINFLVPPELREESLRHFEAILAGQTIHEEETQRYRKDGKTIPVYLMAYPLEIDEHKQGGIVVCRDLTIQREAMNLLQRSYERRRRNIFFNELIASKKEIRNETYIHAQLLGISFKEPFLIFYLMFTEAKGRLSSAAPNQEMSIRILSDKMIDWLSEKSGVYAWESQEGIGIMYTAPKNHRGEVPAEKEIAANLLEMIRGDFPQVAMALGIAEFRPEMEYFGERYQQARISALIGLKIRPNHSIHHYLDTGAFPLLARLVDDEESKRFLERTIGKLLKYDQANGTNLFYTLERMIAHENLRAVADEMFLHYKTILFRKQSIEKILGVSLDSFEGRTLLGTVLALYYFQEMRNNI